MNMISNLWRRSPSLCVGLMIALFVALRVVIIVASPLEIGPDEAQYWRWSEKLDFGYYSKPPLIAWVIAASTAVFGDGEWAIRLLAPVLHGGAAFFLFLLGSVLNWPTLPTLLMLPVLLGVYYRLARTEEAEAEAAFGEAYRDYLRRSGMFFPRLRNAGSK